MVVVWWRWWCGGHGGEVAIVMWGPWWCGCCCGIVVHVVVLWEELELRP